MLTAVIVAFALQQAAGGAVWDTASAPEAAPAQPAASLVPTWGLADPFAWERSQCSPLIRREASLEVCQTRVRTQLAQALGDRLPAGLTPAGEPVPCLATPGDDGAYPVRCGLPERQTAQAVTPQIPDCRPRPTRQGGSVSFTTECRTENADDGGLSFKLFGKD